LKTRYTDKEAIDAAIMALGGINNKRLVEAFQKQNINAFGFSGIDGRVIEAIRKRKILVLVNGKKIMKRGEYSGKIEKVNAGIIDYLLKNKYLPVISSLAKSEEGDIVNVDGDRAASSVAEAINAEILISLTDVEGIYKKFDDKDSLIKSIKYKQLESLLDNLEGGMKKKAYAVLEALKKNIKKVIVCSGLADTPIVDALEKNAGTVVLNE